MTYCLNKFVGWALSPIGLGLPAVALGIVFAALKRRRATVVALSFAACWLWFWGMPATVRLVGVSLERPYLADGRIPAPSDFPQAEAIVVLGGGMSPAIGLGEAGDMNAGADRVWQGARLWKAARAPRLIATGTRVRESTGALLADLGVPADAVTYLPEPRNTEEEARAVAAAGVTNVLLVTSAWHMERARLLFGKYAPSVRVVPAPSDFESTVAANNPVRFADFFPCASAFYTNSSAFREFVALVGYRLFR